MEQRGESTWIAVKTNVEVSWWVESVLIVSCKDSRKYHFWICHRDVAWHVTYDGCDWCSECFDLTASTLRICLQIWRMMMRSSLLLLKIASSLTCETHKKYHKNALCSRILKQKDAACQTITDTTSQQSGRFHIGFRTDSLQRWPNLKHPSHASQTHRILKSTWFFGEKHRCLPAHGELASLVRSRWSSWSPKLSETELCQSECQARNRLNTGNFTEKSVNTGNIAFLIFLMLFCLFARSVLCHEFIGRAGSTNPFGLLPEFVMIYCTSYESLFKVSGADNSMFLLWCLAHCLGEGDWKSAGLPEQSARSASQYLRLKMIEESKMIHHLFCKNFLMLLLILLILLLLSVVFVDGWLQWFLLLCMLYSFWGWNCSYQTVKHFFSNMTWNMSRINNQDSISRSAF